MYFMSGHSWDCRILQVMQKLPELECIGITVSGGMYCREDRHGSARLDCELTPFIGLRSLRTLQLGDHTSWSPNALRRFGQLQADLSRSRREMKFSFW